MSIRSIGTVTVAAVWLLTDVAVGATPVGTGFTYQGRLQQNGQPLTGTVNLQFSLWDVSGGGARLGAVQTINGVVVTNGLFVARLNAGGEFGPNAFGGQSRWLEVSVNGTLLAPRQEVTPAPYALFALNGGAGASNWLNDGDNVYLPTGNAGIGTQTPTEMLHLNRPYVDTALRFQTVRFQEGPPLSTAKTAGAASVGGAGQAWASPTSARLSDDARATVSLSGAVGEPDPSTSQNLTLSTYAFNLPAGAVIVGISVQIEAQSACSCSDCDQCRINGTVELLGGSASTESRSFNFPGAEATVVAGGTFDKWGLEWTPAQVNASGFGARLAGSLSLLNTVICFPGLGCSYSPCDCTGTGTAGIDAVSMTVYYYDAAVSSTPVNWTLGIPETLSALQIAPTADLSNPILHIDPAGRVGINTTNTMQFNLAVNGFAGKPGGGSWSSLSDERLKQNTKLMEGTLDKLLSLHGYEFEYTDKALATQFCLPGRQIGLLAQEVERVFPDWVGKTDDGYLHVTERGTTALVVESLRDLRTEKDRELAEKDAQLRTQQQRIEDLESRLARIEKALSGAASQDTPADAR